MLERKNSFLGLLQLFMKILGTLVLIVLLAELLSGLILPKPTVHKLPMVQFMPDAASGYRLKPNQKAYTLGSLATINSWGFRGKNWELKKPENTVRIAILGSSYAFGHGVSDEATYSSQLEKLLNENSKTGIKYEVMNFGLGGYDTGHEINALKAHALKFQPDIVVLSFFFNDMFYIKDYGFYAQMFEEQNAKFSRFSWEIRNFMRHSRLAMHFWDQWKDRKGALEPGEVASAMNAYVREGVMPPAGPQAEGWQLITERIREFKQLSQKHGFRPIFMLIPTYQEMLEKNTNPSYVRYLKNLGQELGISPVVAIEAFKKTGKNLNYYLIPYDYHLSSIGHHFIAELLKEKIDSEGLPA